MSYPQFTTEELNNERWIVCEDNANYAISDLGRVKRLTPEHHAKVGHILAAPNCGRGYTAVCWWNHKQQRQYRVKIHQLVAKAFLPAPDEVRNELNHIDHNHANNRANNLEWLSHKENLEWTRLHNLHPHGETHGCSKLTNQDIPRIRTMLEQGQHTYAEIGKLFGIGANAIGDIKRGQTWRHL